MMQTREYGKGTFLRQSFPWGLFHGGKAMCADGKARMLARISMTADTWFSIPAAVKARGKTVSGYVTFGVCPETGEQFVRFIAYQYSKNGHLLAEPVKI